MNYVSKTVKDLRYSSAFKLTCLMDAVKRPKTLGPVTKENLFLVAKAVAGVSVFLQLFWSYNSKTTGRGPAHKVV